MSGSPTQVMSETGTPVPRASSNTTQKTNEASNTKQLEVCLNFKITIFNNA